MTALGTATLSLEHYPHVDLWLYARIMRENADPADRICLTAAMLYTYFAFEAFLNFLGATLCPTEWADEKKFFATHEPRGTMGKLDVLLRRCKLESQFQRGHRIMQTVAELERRRHELVHAKFKGTIQKDVSFRTVAELKDLSPEMYAFGDIAFLDAAMKSVEGLCDSLAQSADVVLGNSVTYGKALRGVSFSHGGTITQMPSE